MQTMSCHAFTFYKVIIKTCFPLAPEERRCRTKGSPSALQAKQTSCPWPPTNSWEPSLDQHKQRQGKLIWRTVAGWKPIVPLESESTGIRSTRSESSTERSSSFAHDGRERFAQQMALADLTSSLSVSTSWSAASGKRQTDTEAVPFTTSKDAKSRRWRLSSNCLGQESAAGSSNRETLNVPSL